MPADTLANLEAQTCMLGKPGKAGGAYFLDAISVASVKRDADVMTPHYAGWSECNPPGDWHSPTPIPFLATPARAPFRFGLFHGRGVNSDDLGILSSWLKDAPA